MEAEKKAASKDPEADSDSEGDEVKPVKKAAGGKEEAKVKVKELKATLQKLKDSVMEEAKKSEGKPKQNQSS